MSLLCAFGFHRPMLNSIVKRRAGFTALCDRCALPIERPDLGSWAVAEALASRKGEAA